MSYKFDSIVGKNEADVLKEMIFRRARERSQSMNEDVQSDVMDMARESFVSKNNPFSQIITDAEKANAVSAGKTEVTQQEIGFPQKELKPRAVEERRTVEYKITSDTINNNMIEARSGLQSRKSFMGALDFLNSQAAVSLMRTRSDKFEVVI